MLKEVRVGEVMRDGDKVHVGVCHMLPAQVEEHVKS